MRHLFELRVNWTSDFSRFALFTWSPDRPTRREPNSPLIRSLMHVLTSARGLSLCWVIVPCTCDARQGAEYVISTHRRATKNFRTRFTRIIKRAGLKPWPKLFQNLRSTRQTELEETYPSHVVCAWIGNSQAVAQKHYLQVTDDHFAKAVQNPAQQARAEQCLAVNSPDDAQEKPPENQGDALVSTASHSDQVGDTGLEQPPVFSKETAISSRGGAESGAPPADLPASDPDLRLVVEAWPTLPEPMRAAILAIVRTATG